MSRLTSLALQAIACKLLLWASLASVLVVSIAACSKEPVAVREALEGGVSPHVLVIPTHAGSAEILSGSDSYSLGKELVESGINVVEGATFSPVSGGQLLAVWEFGRPVLIVDYSEDVPILQLAGTLTGQRTAAFSQDGSYLWIVQAVGQDNTVVVQRVELPAAIVSFERKIDVGSTALPRIVSAEADALFFAVDDLSRNDVANETLFEVSEESVVRSAPPDNDGLVYVAASSHQAAAIVGARSNQLLVTSGSVEEATVVDPPEGWVWTPVHQVPTPSTSPSLTTVNATGSRLLLGLVPAGRRGDLPERLVEIDLESGAINDRELPGARRFNAAFYGRDGQVWVIVPLGSSKSSIIDPAGASRIETEAAITSAG